MGGRIAKAIERNGYSVTVWNRTPDTAREAAAGSSIEVAPTPRAAVAEADIVISMVTDDEASRQVWLDPTVGAMAAMPADSIAVESSTVTVDQIGALDREARRLDIGFVEAPVVGSRPQADAGSLLVLAGGHADAVAKARPVLNAYAGRVEEVGPAGHGAVLKLAINGLFGIQVAAYAEIVGLLQRTAVPEATAIELLASLPVTSPALERVLGLIHQRQFTPNFPVELVAKDFRYLRALANDLRSNTPLVESAGAVFDLGATAGEGQLDISGIAERYLVPTA